MLVTEWPIVATGHGNLVACKFAVSVAHSVYVCAEHYGVFVTLCLNEFSKLKARSLFQILD
jgi:hypothetical protein